MDEEGEMKTNTPGRRSLAATMVLPLATASLAHFARKSYTQEEGRGRRSQNRANFLLMPNVDINFPREHKAVFSLA